MDTKITIIAEIGKNFVCTEEPESLDRLLARAKALILSAKEAGADIAKFQIHNLEDEIHPETSIISPHFNHERLSWVQRNTYPVSFWGELYDYCREVGIEFLATPMSRGAAILLNEDIGTDRWKIGSGDITDYVLLDYVRDTGKPVILSSGMSTLRELRDAYTYLAEKTRDITILHCVSIYPCPTEDLGLGTIEFLRREFPGVPIGFSDHSIGLEGPLMAASMQPAIIEKHLTMDRSAWGPDHKVSIEPDELRELVARIRSGDVLEPSRAVYGVETKYIREEEAGYRPIFRKGLYAARDIGAHELWEPSMIISMRPKLPNARPSEEYPTFLGRMAGIDYKKHQPL